MSDGYADWHTKLFHLRFSRLVLLTEKWASVMFFCWFLLFGVAHATLVVIGLAFFLLYLHAHISHRNLEEAAGIPTTSIVLRV